jgi:hypothetical protein
VSGPFEMIGDPDAAACEGDFCALPTEPRPEQQAENAATNDVRVLGDDALDRG